jgi:hypothetical protein
VCGGTTDLAGYIAPNDTCDIYNIVTRHVAPFYSVYRYIILHFYIFSTNRTYIILVKPGSLIFLQLFKLSFNYLSFKWTVSRNVQPSVPLGPLIKGLNRFWSLKLRIKKKHSKIYCDSSLCYIMQSWLPAVPHTGSVESTKFFDSDSAESQIKL